MPKSAGWPAHFFLGIGLVAVCWPLIWAGPPSHFVFFPLWLGYILSVDGMVRKRSGASLLTRSPMAFASLFAISIPVWWLFELVNRRVGSWEYLGVEELSTGEYAFWASLNFSIVVPAVFETAELLATYRWSASYRRRRPLRVSPSLLSASAVTGLTMLVLLLTWPGIFYPFTWLFLLLILEPLARTLGRPSILGHVERGSWRPAVVLASGALLCGFFWELWNYYSYPKWVYHVPGFDFAHVFEMPLAGYLGYLPFGLQLYTITQLICKRPRDFEL